MELESLVKHLSLDPSIPIHFGTECANKHTFRTSIYEPNTIPGIHIKKCSALDALITNNSLGHWNDFVTSKLSGEEYILIYMEERKGFNPDKWYDYMPKAVKDYLQTQEVKGYYSLESEKIANNFAIKEFKKYLPGIIKLEKIYQNGVW